jgi:hypothetical protein
MNPHFIIVGGKLAKSLPVFSKFGILLVAMALAFGAFV